MFVGFDQRAGTDVLGALCGGLAGHARHARHARHASGARAIDTSTCASPASSTAAPSNNKATVTSLVCSGLTRKATLTLRNKLNVNVIGFNNKCLSVMDAVAAQPDQPVAFADGTVEPAVVCGYNGFRNDVASVEISDGDGFASNMTLKDATGAVLAQLTNVTSDTDFTQAGFPGFACVDPTARGFGSSADRQLAAATYPLHMQANVPGLLDSDGAGLRSSVQTLDSQLRLKVSTCARQLGITASIPRTADACGIPTI